MIHLLAAHPWCCLIETVVIPTVIVSGRVYIKEALSPHPVSQRNDESKEVES